MHQERNHFIPDPAAPRLISLVVPVYQEADNIVPFLHGIQIASDGIEPFRKVGDLQEPRLSIDAEVSAIRQ